jgi:hypothetical protein
MVDPRDRGRPALAGIRAGDLDRSLSVAPGSRMATAMPE